MPISLSLNSSVTVDGVAHQVSGTSVIQCRNLTRQTRDLTSTYARIAEAVNGYYVFINYGDESAYIQIVTGGADYLRFQCTPGAHVIIPTSIDNTAATAISFVEARSATSAGTRIGIITIDIGI